MREIDARSEMRDARMNGLKVLAIGLLFCLAQLPQAIHGQSLQRKVFSPGGSVFSHNGQEYGFTIGEPIIGTDQLSFPNLTKGFQQPEPLTILPITVSLHQAIPSGSGSDVLTWSTSQDAGTSHFSIERAIGAGAFVEIHQVMSHGGAEYRTTVSNTGLSSFYRYRIRQIMADGVSWASNEVELQVLTSSAQWELYPNPARETCYLQLTEAGEIPLYADIRVFDSHGAEVFAQRITNDLEAPLPLQPL